MRQQSKIVTLICIIHTRTIHKAIVRNSITSNTFTYTTRRQNSFSRRSHIHHTILILYHSNWCLIRSRQIIDALFHNRNQTTLNIMITILLLALNLITIHIRVRIYQIRMISRWISLRESQHKKIIIFRKLILMD